MNLIRTFLIGIFTENLRTKAMSLVIAAALFYFVQEQLTGSETIEQLVLRFDLAPELRDEQLLVQDTYPLRNVTIQGFREDVDRVRGELEKKRWTIEITIDRAFLDQHKGEVNTRIDAAFCKKHNIPDEKVEVVAGPEFVPVLDIDNLETVRGLQLAPAPDVPLALSPDNPWETPGGGKLDVEFNRQAVDVSGPQGAFQNPLSEYRTLYLRFTNPDEWLRTKRSENDRERWTGPNIGQIAWEESGFDPKLVHLVRIDGLPPDEFQRRTYPYFEVVARRQEVNLSVEIAVRDSVARDVRLRQEYEYFNQDGLKVFEAESIAKGRCPQLLVRMPKALIERRKEIQDKLVLIVDLLGVEITDAIRRREDDLRVPLRLAVKNPQDKALLDSISIVTDRQPPILLFKHKE